MDVLLLKLVDWHALLHDPNERERRRGQFLMGTIVDVLQVAEGCKKGDAVALSAFRAGWEALNEVPGGLLQDGTLQLCALDKDCLLDALFDWDRTLGEEGISLWAPAADPTTRPWRTMRRLILRPTEQRYWDQDLYDVMEQMFGEEPDRNE
jgi:hypothetical protein